MKLLEGYRREREALEAAVAHATRPALDLFLISLLSLFAEVLMIRWLGTEVRVLSYFKNVVLLSCFLGLGLGFRLSSRPACYGWFIPSLAAFSFLVELAARRGVLIAGNPKESSFHIWGNVATVNETLFYAFVLSCFFVNTLLFIPLGQWTGKLMQHFSPLKAYSLNIAGGLAGIWLFVLLNWGRCPPWIWFGLLLVLAFYFLRSTPRWMALGAAAAFPLLILQLLPTRGIYWSPYYKIHMSGLLVRPKVPEKRPLMVGYELRVNQDYHQRMTNLSRNFVQQYHADYPDLAEFSVYYDFPYQFHPKPRKVLVVGAGTGNDVASALRHGVERVDAVEIDPGIYELGLRHHPEKPYDSRSVRVIIDDARAYLRRTSETYDLIVYGLLDSHTLFSTMNSLRLDNFVYTVESFREARHRLNPGGMVALSFSIGENWIATRIFRMLEEAFGKPPLAFPLQYDGSWLFVIGERLDTRPIPGTRAAVPSQLTLPPALDDWPYLYLRERSIPSSYLVILAAILGLSFVLVRSTGSLASGWNWHFFFLGAGFLLIETRSIIELALTFGTTWTVNAVVISGILLLILAANLYKSRAGAVRLKLHYALLAASILLGYFFPVGRALLPLRWVNDLLATLVVLLPLFFAGVIFATSLERDRDYGRVFGSNLLGAMLGGALEYGSLVAGIKFLYVLSLLTYLASFVTRPKAEAQ